MATFIRDGIYCSGDPLPGDIECPERPDPTYQWDGSAWQATAATHNAPILAQIAELEAAGDTARRRREGATSDAGRQWLVNLDAQITALRVQLVK